VLLTNETNEDIIDGYSSSKKIKKFPTILIHGVIKYGEIIKWIRDIAEDEQFCTKRQAKNVIKIKCLTPETHRKLISYLHDNNIIYHTFRLKEGLQNCH